jgi:type III pantothenate kinase
LAVDIGNSTTKFGLFNHPLGTSLPEPVWVYSLPTGAEVSSELFVRLPAQALWLVASVQREAEARLADWVTYYRRGDPYHRLLSTEVPLPTQVDYPDRVGVDRLAAALAANQLRSGERAAVVIGAGSALTIDLLSPDGIFQGGAILAGFRMCAEALAAKADLLPLALLEAETIPPPLPGKNTEAAIRAGLFWGAVGAARELVARYGELYPHPEVFVSGGDLERLAPLVAESAQFVPQLALRGIAFASSPYWKSVPHGHS